MERHKSHVEMVLCHVASSSHVLIVRLDVGLSGTRVLSTSKVERRRPTVKVMRSTTKGVVTADVERFT